MRIKIPDGQAATSQTVSWKSVAATTVVSASAWIFWAELFPDSVTRLGFGITMLCLAIWIAGRERYPLSMLIGLFVGLVGSFVVLYSRESPLWIVASQMILIVTCGPMVIIFAICRVVFNRVGARQTER